MNISKELLEKARTANSAEELLAMAKAVIFAAAVVFSISGGGGTADQKSNVKGKWVELGGSGVRKRKERIK